MKISPIYLISSDEPVLRDEAIKKIETLAHQSNYSLIKRWQVDTHFDWFNFFTNLEQRDLFGDKCLVELHLNSSKLSAEVGQRLTAFLVQANVEQILLLSCDKLDKATLKNQWVSVIEQYGTIIQLWPLEAAMLLNWLANKSSEHGLKLSRDSLAYIAAHSEGNLTAAAQTLEKLSLQYGAVLLSHAQICANLADQSRYTTFDLVKAWLNDDKLRSYKILHSLKADAVEPILIWWTLTVECRLLAQIRFGLTKNISLVTLLNTFQVWKKREPLIKLHLYKPYDYHAGLQQLAGIERIIKGLEKGLVWDELENFLLISKLSH